MDQPFAKPMRGSGEKRQVLVVDDDPVTLRVLSHYLSSAGFDVVTAEDGRSAMQKMTDEILVAVFDLEMPHASGLECLRFVRQKHPDTNVIVVSGKGEIRDAVAAMKEGAFDYVTKPFDRDELIARVNQASWTSLLARDNQGLREAVSSSAPSCDFVARTPAAQELLWQVKKVAAIDSTVLITGESGTGKTTVARMIHQSSPRAKGPFVTVNCASLPRDLVEAELFGHAKGAFTGAINDRPGRAEIADGGTLFLDEIGDLPLELQPKLLTFLQDRTFQRIGSNKIYNVDVRVITATHQDLANMCREKRFREDLYFRLNVIAIDTPALRDRPDDIPELSQAILNRIGKRRGQKPLACSSQAIEVLKQHSWPGNVRELENVLERASVFCETETIEVRDLSFPGVATKATPVAPVRPASLSGRSLDDIEKHAIIDTLEACGNNKAEAARRLGISEKSIYNKMRRFGLME